MFDTVCSKSCQETSHHHALSTVVIDLCRYKSVPLMYDEYYGGCVVRVCDTTSLTQLLQQNHEPLGVKVERLVIRLPTHHSRFTSLTVDEKQLNNQVQEFAAECLGDEWVSTTQVVDVCMYGPMDKHAKRLVRTVAAGAAQAKFNFHCLSLHKLINLNGLKHLVCQSRIKGLHVVIKSSKVWNIQPTFKLTPHITDFSLCWTKGYLCAKWLHKVLSPAKNLTKLRIEGSVKNFAPFVDFIPASVQDLELKDRRGFNHWSGVHPLTLKQRYMALKNVERLSITCPGVGLLESLGMYRGRRLELFNHEKLSQRLMANSIPKFFLKLSHVKELECDCISLEQLSKLMGGMYFIDNAPILFRFESIDLRRSVVGRLGSSHCQKSRYWSCADITEHVPLLKHLQVDLALQHVYTQISLVDAVLDFCPNIVDIGLNIKCNQARDLKWGPAQLAADLKAKAREQGLKVSTPFV